MNTKRANKGFTLLETMIAVALLVILSSLAIIGIISYMRSMRQLEYDGTAEEIFVAAQNHLALADSQGLLDHITGDPGTKDDAETKGNVYYVTWPTTAGTNDQKVLDLILPFGSIDEAVRSTGSGSYLIRYDKNAAQVLDVFYCGDQQIMTSDNLATLKGLKGSEKAKTRRDSSGLGSRAIVGWYGGDGLGSEYVTLNTPVVMVENAERLVVKVTDPNGRSSDSKITAANPKLCLIVEGVSSGAKMAFNLDFSTTYGSDSNITRDESVANQYEYSVVLDDVTTSGRHFADIAPTAANSSSLAGNVLSGVNFIPGEDLKVYAEAYSSTKLVRIAKSATYTTNSLYSSVKPASDDNNAPRTAVVKSIRHLENLEEEISSVDLSGVSANNLGPITAARQPSNMGWKSFMKHIRTANKLADDAPVNIYTADNTRKSADNTYLPVNPDKEIAYDGRGKKISSVEVNITSGEAGLFGTLQSGSSVKDLQLVNFKINTDNGNAGALAGTVLGTTPTEPITNVVAYNSKGDGTDKDYGVTASKNAGGLVGSIANGTITKSAASLYVQGGTTAGGLVGSAASTTITASYSGGHTEGGVYNAKTAAEAGESDKTHINVAGVTAGGLVGVGTNSTSISQSYSTCSVQGNTAGGLVGNLAGSASNCYATGLVKGATGSSGAFIGTRNGVNLSGNRYLEIVNYVLTEDGKSGSYMPVFGDLEENEDISGVISAADANTGSYQGFVADGDANTDKSEPYDPALTTWYGTNYHFPSIAALDAGVVDTDFVATHHGDWPMPELLVVNTK